MSPALLLRLGWPDVLERVRRASFLLTVGMTIWLGSLVYTNNIQMSVGQYRGVVNSAWLALSWPCRRRRSCRWRGSTS